MSWTTRAPAVKRVLASASLAATAAGVVHVVRYDGTLDTGTMIVVAVLGAASLGFARRSVLSQVLARGVAWMALSPMLVATADALGHGRLPETYTVFLAATSAGALLLGRPALHTYAARAEFSPVRYRRAFLAGAVASVMAAVVVAFFALEQVLWHARGSSVGLAVLASALLASAVGVVRMRAWGVLLGLLTSAGAFGAALLAGNELTAVGLALAAIPGLLLASPLAAARLRKPAPLPALPAPRHSLQRRDMPGEESLDAAPPFLARVAVAPEAACGEPAPTARVVGAK